MRSVRCPVVRVVLVAVLAVLPGSVSAAQISPAPGSVPLLAMKGSAYGPLALGGGFLVFARSNGQQNATSTVVEQRSLQTGRTRRLASDSLPLYGLASTSDWVVYAAQASRGIALVAVRHDRTRRLVLTRSLLAPLAARGDRIAWAEGVDVRQRVLVRNMRTGRTWVAADLPRCLGGRCYRIDFVTLADDGVAFDRGAVGPQASYVVRRRFDGPVEPALVRNDPQPDLVPSSSGALYYAYGRGWMRWDFGQKRPRLARIAGVPRTQVLALDRGRLLLFTGDRCRAKLVIDRPAGASLVYSSPVSSPLATHAFGPLCASLTGFVLDKSHLTTAWALIPDTSIQAHSDVGLVGLIVRRKLP